MSHNIPKFHANSYGPYGTWVQLAHTGPWSPRVPPKAKGSSWRVLRELQSPEDTLQKGLVSENSAQNTQQKKEEKKIEEKIDIRVPSQSQLLEQLKKLKKVTKD